MVSPLYLITCVFNPRRFHSRIKLYKRFVDWVTKAGVKLLTVEIAFGERDWDVTEASNPWHVRLRTKQEIWHKERALNLGLQRLTQLEPHWKYVAWIDADIKIARDDWPTEIPELLQHYALIQLFGECRSLGPDHHALEHCTRMISVTREYASMGDRLFVPAPPGKYQPAVATGHPGLGWAFRRDELNDIGGWLDICANGSGDTHMANCFMGEPIRAVPKEVSPGFRGAIERYGELCDKYVRKNVSYMPGAVDHYFHGRSRERGYEERHRILIQYQFDPTTDLILADSGLHRWNMAIPRVHDMAREVRRSLASRNEDVNEA